MDERDIVIDGWEQGIADSPHTGVNDMRNLDILSMPGEALVGFKNTAVTLPPALNAVAYTAEESDDRLTIADASLLYDKAAIVLAANLRDFIASSANKK